jgi:hypothetical protein
VKTEQLIQCLWCNCASIPPYVFMAWCLIKQKGNFTLQWLEFHMKTSFKDMITENFCDNSFTIIAGIYFPWSNSFSVIVIILLWYLIICCKCYV